MKPETTSTWEEASDCTFNGDTYEFEYSKPYLIANFEDDLRGQVHYKIEVPTTPNEAIGKIFMSIE